MKYTRIPAGYRVTITSWENDGDNRNTAYIGGLSWDQVRLLVKLAELFHSHNQQGERWYGNLYSPTDAEREVVGCAIQTTFDKYNTHEPTWSIDRCRDMLADLQLMGCSEFYTRVLDNVVVEYYPDAFDIEDVTDQFVAE